MLYFLNFRVKVKKKTSVAKWLLAFFWQNWQNLSNLLKLEIYSYKRHWINWFGSFSIDDITVAIFLEFRAVFISMASEHWVNTSNYELRLWWVNLTPKNSCSKKGAAPFWELGKTEIIQHATNSYLTSARLLCSFKIKALPRPVTCTITRQYYASCFINVNYIH